MSNSSQTMRTIHHFACSGGTVISKCIQAMQSTVVISEIHPLHVRYAFNPFDPVQLFVSQTQLATNSKLKMDIFKSRIKQCAEISQYTNTSLVLRDHTHSDYFLVKTCDEIKTKSSLLDAISSTYNVRSLVTIRNPLESYLSLKGNKWDLNVPSFSDYCDRLHMMIKHYKTLDIHIKRYEDFCSTPSKFLKHTCEILELEFNPKFQEIFYKIPMTGDSGRGKQSALNTIQQLPAKKIPEELLLEASVSKSFLKISDEYDYKFS